MDVKLTLPDEILEALGPDPEREALEGLLLLVGESRLSLDRAGEVLGLEDRTGAERWYAERVSSRSGLGMGNLSSIEEPVHLKDLTQEDLDRSNRFLRITPAKQGSGLSDVSMDHDKYLYGDG